MLRMGFGNPSEAEGAKTKVEGEKIQWIIAARPAPVRNTAIARHDVLQLHCASFGHEFEFAEKHSVNFEER